MTKRTKRVLFYSAVLVFLFLSYIVILYAQGYKYSFSEGKFQRTGAITLKVNTDASVFLDDELEGSTSFFNHAFSIDRLLPGKYKLTVQKDDFSSWSKIVNIEEGFVVDFPVVLILPEEGDEETELFSEVGELFENLIVKPTPIPKPTQSPNLSTTPLPSIDEKPFILDLKSGELFQNNDQTLLRVDQNVRGFQLSKNQNKIAWWTNNELWVMWLTDTNYQPFQKKGEKELITRFAMIIQNGIWFRDEDHVVLELERLDSKNRPYSIYQVVEIDKRGGINIVEL